MFSGMTAAHGGENLPARLELGRIADDLSRQLDVVADCMRRDVGLGRVFVKMRRHAEARNTPEAQITAMNAPEERREPIVTANRAAAILAANRAAASRSSDDVDMPDEPLPDEDDPHRHGGAGAPVVAGGGTRPGA